MKTRNILILLVVLLFVTKPSDDSMRTACMNTMEKDEALHLGLWGGWDQQKASIDVEDRLLFKYATRKGVTIYGILGMTL